MHLARDEVIVVGDTLILGAFLDRLPELCLLHQCYALLPEFRIGLLAEPIPKMNVFMNWRFKFHIVLVEIKDAVLSKAKHLAA